MTIHRPGRFDSIYRLQPVFGDQDEGDPNNGSRPKKVHYQGRSWSESEEELPILPQASQPKTYINSLEKPPIYADLELYKTAKKQFEKLTTLEEKLAQICFYQTEASYDHHVFNQTKELVQNYQISGILFTSGEYKRQNYLIEYYQTMSKIPLLIGNDFHHGLSFFQPESLTKEHNEQHYYDLGKVIMLQNLRMGVHFQCDQALSEKASDLILSENDRKAFRKGIRVANGIVGKFQSSDQVRRRRCIPQFSLDKGSVHAHIGSVVEDEINEILGLKTIEFYDLTQINMPITQEHWVKFFNQSKEFLLISQLLPVALKSLFYAIQSKQISEEELDKRVFKALLVKAFFKK